MPEQSFRENDVNAGRPCAEQTAPGLKRIFDVPDVRIERVGEHFYIRAGCQTAICHQVYEVYAFLSEQLVKWIQDGLGPIDFMAVDAAEAAKDKE